MDVTSSKRKRDALEEYIDHNKYRIVVDDKTGENVVLTDHELSLLNRVQNVQYGDTDFDPYEDWVDFFEYEDGIHPLSSAPEPKRRFVPSKWEAKKVMKLVRAIRKGWIKPKSSQKEEKPEDKFYLLWDTATDDMETDRVMHIPAPKPPPPTHGESYNPPQEYLPSLEEAEEWNNKDPQDRELSYLPTQHSALRRVPLYENGIKDRFDRCLDLYLCARAVKKRMHVDDPESLLPNLPSPAELRPFPNTLAATYEGHEGAVRSVAVDPSGQALASGSDDGTVCVWEIQSGRLLAKHEFGAAVSSVAWCPSHVDVAGHGSILSVCSEHSVSLLWSGLGRDESHEQAVAVLRAGASWKSQSTDNAKAAEESEALCQWTQETGERMASHSRLKLNFKKNIRQLRWHKNGDHFVTVAPDAQSTAVLVHRFSRHITQNPFKKHSGIVQCAMFHPSKPFLMVATKQHIRIYNMLKQSMIKKLFPGVNMVSSMAIHPAGDNIIVGSFEKRLLWFDLELSGKPYRALRYHRDGIKDVSFHSRYPLFASCSDDGTIHVLHGV